MSGYKVASIIAPALHVIVTVSLDPVGEHEHEHEGGDG